MFAKLFTLVLAMFIEKVIFAECLVSLNLKAKYAFVFALCGNRQRLTALKIDLLAFLPVSFWLTSKVLMHLPSMSSDNNLRNTNVFFDKIAPCQPPRPFCRCLSPEAETYGLCRPSLCLNAVGVKKKSGQKPGAWIPDSLSPGNSHPRQLKMASQDPHYNKQRETFSHWWKSVNDLKRHRTEMSKALVATRSGHKFNLMKAPGQKFGAIEVCCDLLWKTVFRPTCESLAFWNLWRALTDGRAAWSLCLQLRWSGCNKENHHEGNPWTFVAFISCKKKKNRTKFDIIWRNLCI